MALAVIVVRLALVGQHQGLWGVDVGAYLISAHSYMGIDQSVDFLRPPFAPGLLLVPFLRLFGDDIGTKLFAVAATVPLSAAWWWLCRHVLTPWQSVYAMVLLSADWMLAEMFAAGDLPMIGFAALLVAIVALWRFSERYDWRMGAMFVASAAAIPYVNQTSAGIAVLVLPLALVAIGLERRRLTPTIVRITPWAILAGTLCLPLVTIYLAVAPGAGILRYPGPLVTTYPWPNIAWVLALAGAAFAGLLLWRSRGLMRVFGVILLCLAFLVPLFSRDETVLNVFYRARYLESMLISLAAVWGVGRLLAMPDGKVAGWLYAGVAAPAFIIIAATQIQSSIARDTMITTDTMAALEYIAKQPENGTLIANSYSMALGIAGLTNRTVAWPQAYEPPRAYTEQHADVLCILGWDDGCDVDQAVARRDAAYVIVDTRWPAHSRYSRPSDTNRWDPKRDFGYIWGMPQVPDPWAVTANQPWLTPVFEQGSTVVWQIQMNAEA